MITASLTGIVVGIVVGMLGAGGGILAVPILVYALGQSPHSATAESLVIVGLTALVAMATRWRAVHLREGFIFGFGAIVGAAIGSRLSPLVDGRILLLLFSVFLFCVGTAMAIKALPGREVENQPSHTQAPGGGYTHRARHWNPDGFLRGRRRVRRRTCPHPRARYPHPLRFSHFPTGHGADGYVRAARPHRHRRVYRLESHTRVRIGLNARRAHRRTTFKEPASKGTYRCFRWAPLERRCVHCSDEYGKLKAH